MKKINKNSIYGESYRTIVTALAVAVAFSLVGPIAAFAATAPDLGAAGDFAILTHAGITDVPTSIITGNIGTDGVGSSIGVPCPEVTGIMYAIDATGPACSVIDATLLGTAMTDEQTAYTTANGEAIDVTNAGDGFGEIGGLTLAPGVYTFTGGSINVLISTDLALNGNATDVWIFQIPGTFDVATDKKVTLTGGALAKNVFWAVAGQTTLHAGSTLEGNILDYAGIAMQNLAILHGRAFSHTASVTLIANTISASAPAPTAPICSLANANPNTVNSLFTPQIDSTIIRENFAYLGRETTCIGPSLGTPGDTIFWKVTVHGPAALTADMVDLNEVGWKDQTTSSTAVSIYPLVATGGDLVTTGSCDAGLPAPCTPGTGFSLDANDVFTNADKIKFNANAPTGAYAITYDLVNTNGGAVVGTYTVPVAVTVPPTTPPAPAPSPCGGGGCGGGGSGGGGGGGYYNNPYAITINGGATQTASINVTLTLTTIAGMHQMWISNYPSFAASMGTGWIPFQAIYPWTLTPGLGNKTVYVSFGNTSTVAPAESAEARITVVGEQVLGVSPSAGQVLGASAHRFTNDLAIGSQGSDVTELQKQLTAEGVYSGPITGYFGPLTFGAVKKYQEGHGITAVGMVGPVTRARFNSSLAAASATGNVLGASTSADAEAIKVKISALRTQLVALLQQLAAMLKTQGQ